MIVLFTDFGANDLYVGQVKAQLHRHAADTDIVDLLHNAPQFNVRASAHLLAALGQQFGVGSVFLAVVDPGVGSDREPVVVQADGKWFVGPDNGLLSVVAARASGPKFWRITWTPENLSPSFHGRDLFAAIAALIAKGDFPREKLADTAGLQQQFDAHDLLEIIYVDHYGNCFTGLRAKEMPRDALLMIGQFWIGHARVFSEAAKGKAFWYENSIGLVEIAVNSGSAAQTLGLRIGSQVFVVTGA